MAQELAARRAVRAALEERWPEAAARIRPSVIIDKDELPDDPALRRSFQRLLAAHPMGDQYIYLALLARSLGLDALELCVHRDDRAAETLRPHTRPVEGYPTEAVRLGPEAPAEYDVFRPFVLPLLDVAKVAMRRRAEEQGTIAALERSWSCHEPLLGRPCGRCNPCRTTREEGLEHRTPPVASARAGAALARHAARRARHHAGRNRARLVRRWRSLVR